MPFVLWTWKCAEFALMFPLKVSSVPSRQHFIPHIVHGRLEAKDTASLFYRHVLVGNLRCKINGRERKIQTYCQISSLYNFIFAILPKQCICSRGKIEGPNMDLLESFS